MGADPLRHVAELAHDIVVSRRRRTRAKTFGSVGQRFRRRLGKAPPSRSKTRLLQINPLAEFRVPGRLDPWPNHLNDPDGHRLRARQLLLRPLTFLESLGVEYQGHVAVGEPVPELVLK